MYLPVHNWQTLKLNQDQAFLEEIYIKAHFITRYAVHK